MAESTVYHGSKQYPQAGRPSVQQKPMFNEHNRRASGLVGTAADLFEALYHSICLADQFQEGGVLWIWAHVAHAML